MMIIGLSHYGVVAYIYIYLYMYRVCRLMMVFCLLFVVYSTVQYIDSLTIVKKCVFIVNGCHICGKPQTHCSCSSLPTILLSKSVFIFFCSLTCQLIDRSKKNIFPSEWVPSVGETSGHCSPSVCQ